MYTVCREIFVVAHLCELYTTCENNNRENMDVVQINPMWIDYAWGHCISTSSKILLFQAHTDTILKCPFFCHWFMANNSHWAIDHCYRIGHYFQPLVRKSILQAWLDPEPRRLCRYGDPSYSFHKRTLLSFSHVG